MESTLNDLGDKVPEGEASEIRAKIEALREAAKGEDAGAIQTAIEETQQAFSSVSARIYEATQQQQAETSEGAGPTGQEAAGEKPEGDEEVIDAEFTAEDDNQ